MLSACGVAPTAPAPQSVFPSPVAFVTAAPLPQPTPTATPQPLPTATSAPATPAPKPDPQSSAKAIGLWSDQVRSSAAFTGFLDIASGDDAAAYRQTRNPLAVLLNAQQVSVISGDAISDLIKTTPDAVLYDRNKKIVRDSAGNAVLNIRLESVRQNLADTVANALDNADGVLLYGVGDNIIRARDTPVFTGTTAFTEKQRRDAVEGLLRAVRARVPDRLLIVGGYAWRDGAAYASRSEEARDLSAIVDGLHVEAFARSPLSDTNAFRSETAWKRDVDMLAELSSDDRIVLLSTRIDGQRAGDALTRQWLAYSTATYLLGKNGAKTYFQFDAGSPEYNADPILSAPLGAPLEAYSKSSSGLYIRKFERGLVLVNPTKDSKTFALEGVAYQTLSGATVDSDVILYANTGLILLRRG